MSNKIAAFPPGWVLGFLMPAAEGDSDDELRVAFLPIVGMEANEHGKGIDAIVATTTGALCRASEIEHPVVCIVKPGDDRETAARAGLAEFTAQRAKEAELDIKPGGGAQA